MPLKRLYVYERVWRPQQVVVDLWLGIEPILATLKRRGKKEKITM